MAATLTRLLRRPTSTMSTAAARSVFSSSLSTFTKNSDENPRKITENPNYNKEQPRKTAQLPHPFQTGGPGGLLMITPQGGSCFYLRVCMPGVAKNGVKTWLENNTIFFEGYGEIEDESEETGRNYVGRVEFSAKPFKIEEIQPQMKHGILRIRILGRYLPTWN